MEGMGILGMYIIIIGWAFVGLGVAHFWVMERWMEMGLVTSIG